MSIHIRGFLVCWLFILPHLQCFYSWW